MSFVLPPPYSVKRVPVNAYLGYEAGCDVLLMRGENPIEDLGYTLGGQLSETELLKRGSAIAAFRNLVQYEHPSVSTVIECIANSAIRRDSDGRVFRGHRHNDCISIIRALTGVPRVGGGYTQGFVTNRANRFIDRVEAYTIARLAGQIDHIPHRDGVELFSEDLW